MINQQARDRMLLMLLGRTVAHDLLLRYLITGLAMTHANPKRYVFEIVETILAGMDRAEARPANGAEIDVWGYAETELRNFEQQVGWRLDRIATLQAQADGSKAQPKGAGG